MGRLWSQLSLAIRLSCMWLNHMSLHKMAMMISSSMMAHSSDNTVLILVANSLSEAYFKTLPCTLSQDNHLIILSKPAVQHHTSTQTACISLLLSSKILTSSQNIVGTSSVAITAVLEKYLSYFFKILLASFHLF